MSSCAKHALEITLFCSNPECMATLCLKCLKEHNSHSIFYIEEIIFDLKTFNLEKKQLMEETYKKLSKKNELFLNMTKNFDETTQKNEYLIKQLAIEFLKHIEETLKNLKDENKNKRACFEKILLNCQESLGQLEKKMNDHSAKMKETQENIEKVDYKEIFNKFREIHPQQIDVYEKMVAVDGDLKAAEIDPKVFLLEEMGKFISFDTFSKQKLDSFNEKIDECKKTHEKEMKKAEETQLLLLKLEEDLNVKKEKLKKLDEEFDKHNGKLLQGITQELSKISDSCKDNRIVLQKIDGEVGDVKNTLNIAKPFFISRKFDFIFIDLSFNTQFSKINFENNGKICKNDGNYTTTCFSKQVLSAKFGNKLTWKMTVLGGSCDNTAFGIVERNENVLKLEEFTKNNGIYCERITSNLEVLLIKRDGALLNLQGISSKFPIGDTFTFHLDFINKTFQIGNKSKSIGLVGKITKNDYYFAVSPCCSDRSYFLGTT